MSDSYFHPRLLGENEFVAYFPILVARLDRHIVAVGNGEAGARDDLATILRTLLNPDKGDDALGRFCRYTGMPEPRTALTQINLQQPGLQLAIAGLPVYDSKVPSSSKSVPTELLSTICLGKRDGNKIRKFTWHDIIEGYGNTLGAHLSTRVPRILDEVHLHGLGNVDFGTYMLRSIGVLVSALSHNLLKNLNSNHKGMVHDTYFQGVIVNAVEFTYDGKEYSLAAHAIRQQWKMAGTIVSVANSKGTQFLFGVKDGGYLSLSVIEGRNTSK